MCPPEGVADPATVTPPVVPPVGNEMVNKAELDKVLGEMHKYKKLAKGLEEEKTLSEKKKLTETQQYKELYERSEKEKEDLKKEKDSTVTSYVNDKKFSALKDSCQKLGLKAEAAADLELMDLSGIEVETTSTGKVNILNSDKVAERLKATRPHWFGSGKAAKINSESPGVIDGGGSVTMAQVFEAEKKYQKSQTQEDQATYLKILRKFQAQSRK